MATKTLFKKYDIRLVKESAGYYELDKKISSSKLSIEYFRDVFDLELRPYEVFVMITLDNQNQVNGCFELSRGDLAEAAVYVRQIAQRALLSNAQSVIIAHNHPSGSLMPSSSDKNVTERIKEALALFKISLLDHIIITSDDGFSFAENGLMGR